MSSRIIKKGNVSNIEDKSPIIKTKFNLVKEDILIDEDLPDKGEEEKYNIDEIKENIRESLYDEIEKERNKIINNGKIEVDKIKLEARKKGYKLGYKEGHESGYKEGINKAKEEGRAIKNNAINLIKESEKHVDEYLEENKKEIINLAINIAETIVHSTIDESSEDVLMLVKPILEQYDKKDNIIITCNPENHSNIMKHLNKLESICPNAKFIILEDDSLERNGCIIENKDQVIDLQIKKQIEAILEEIKNLE